VTTDRRLNDAIADEMLDRLARDPGSAAIHHTVQVTSFGGSGTTALYDYLLHAGVDVPTTPGEFPFKHQPSPPDVSCVPAGFRVVYPFGDPRDAVMSVFRRGFQGGHYRGMRLRAPSEQVDARLASLEAFLAAGVDVFGLAEHFAAWNERGHRAYPVLFVRFTELASVWPVVREFVGLPSDAVCLPVGARASSWRDLPPPARVRIDDMYGELAVALEARPSAEIA
jgi:hypothetical protein